MFLITTIVKGTGRKQQPEHSGKLYLRLFQKLSMPDGSIRKIERAINPGLDNVGELGELDKRKIVHRIRLLYCIIENRTDSRIPFSIDDVVNDFHKALSGDKTLELIVRRSQNNFPLRQDLVSVGNDFKADFQFECQRSDSPSNNLLDYIDYKSRMLKQSGRSSSARSYISTRQSLSKFLNGEKTKFGNIDATLIRVYSTWLDNNGVSKSTQSFYLRTLRSILNHAREEGLLTCGENLFNGLNTRVQFATADKSMPSPDRETLRKIAVTDLSGNGLLDLARDLFMFGFYARGMELLEIINLTKLSIKDGQLKYKRRSNGSERVVPLEKGAIEILKKYQGTDAIYLFPLKNILRGRQNNTINDKIGKLLKQVGELVSFPGLSFRMNISAWQNLVSHTSLSDVLMDAT